MLHSEAQVLPVVQTNGDASAKETFSDAKHGLSSSGSRGGEGAMAPPAL